jgi:ectoine hydroxylase-related dioxygenase (phytanoyl-CoA dioxygenase family)
MSSATATLPVTVQGESVDQVELMTDCTPLLDDVDALRQQMQENGYVYLPGYLGRDRVTAARRVFIDSLQRAGALVPGHDPMDGVIRPGAAVGFTGGRLETLFENWRPIHDVLYTGPMIAFFERFLDEAVLHYDFTWTRQVNPGPATALHSDVVYMGRGTHELFTAWTPMGDNGFDLGGLIVLEGSNNHDGLAKSYFKQDVDAFCENKPEARAWGKSWATAGALRGSANQLRRSLGGQRWVTSDYKMGDVVLFNVYTVHGGTDNRSDRVRLSTDTRYQRASAPADERWIGANPAAHGASAKRGLIC